MSYRNLAIPTAEDQQFEFVVSYHRTNQFASKSMVYNILLHRTISKSTNSSAEANEFASFPSGLNSGKGKATFK